MKKLLFVLLFIACIGCNDNIAGTSAGKTSRGTGSTWTFYFNDRTHSTFSAVRTGDYDGSWTIYWDGGGASIDMSNVVRIVVSTP
jgi:hypothetical protein